MSSLGVRLAPLALELGCIESAPQRSRAAAGARLSTVVLWMAVWATVWVVVLSSLNWSPPTDSVEQLIWVRSIEWGYYKHPPLPTVLLWPFVQLFGIHEWVVGTAGALAISAGLLISWRLVRELAGNHFAALAMLGALSITYYSGRTNFYNHNTVLLVFVAGAAWFCWRAFADRSPLAWLALGLMLGLGALTKYQIVLAATSVLAYWLAKGGWRDPVHRRGLLCAVGLAALVFLPHLWWLVTHHFLPFQYASRTSLGAGFPCGQRTAHSLHWLADQGNRLSPALLLMAGLLWKARRASAVPAATPPRAASAVHPDARLFLLAWGVLPLLAIAFIGMVSGADLQFQWGTAFMSFTCAALMAWVPASRWHRVAWRDALIGFLAVQALLLATAWATSPMSGMGLVRSRAGEFRSEHLAAQMGPQARLALGGPIRVIAGPARIASNLALRLPERPLVLLDGDPETSPWVSRKQIERYGVLWVGDENYMPPPGIVRHWLSAHVWWAVHPSIDRDAE